VTVRAFAVGAVAALVVAGALGGVAQARNPHCAGGIQYVSQGMTDKGRGNLEDYQREMMKAVQQLEMCAEQDPVDLEALGYLGWAYAEVDSAGPAGRAFARAIEGLAAKGDKKKAEWATNNRDSYWANAFNDGIAKIRSAQEAYPDFLKAPENEADVTLKGEAEKRYAEALTSLGRATLLRPNHAQTIRSLGSVYAFMGRFKEAEGVFREGLKAAPGDSTLEQSLRAARTNHANALIEQKKYDEAIAYFRELIEAEPTTGDLHSGLADAYFRRAQAREGDERKADFKAAGTAYAKAAELKGGDADLTFNAALAFQNAGDYGLAEGQWRNFLKVRPDDLDAQSALGSVLAELKRYDEAIRVVFKAVNEKPQSKNLHRQLGAIYTKATNNPKATEELMVYLAMQNGQPAPDPAGAAKNSKEGTAAASTLASMGPPDQLIPWEADNDKYETWFYWAKKQALHFKGGALVSKSNWGVMGNAVPGASAPPAPGKRK
jgi:tetratricopeptide (TPR) repeat protein